MKEMITQAAVLGFSVLMLVSVLPGGTRSVSEAAEAMKLPEPRLDSPFSLEKALRERRSVRDYKDEALTLAEVSQLLWAAQGITDARDYRTAPSAGALFPLEITLAAGKVDGLPPGIYRYQPQGHQLLSVAGGDRRQEIYTSALSQTPIRRAPALIVISAVYERTTRKYWERGKRYVHMEAGHSAQNICLQAVALELGTVVIGAFNDDDVKKAVSLPDREEPLYIVPVGRRSH